MANTSPYLGKLSNLTVKVPIVDEDGRLTGSYEDSDISGVVSESINNIFESITPRFIQVDSNITLPNSVTQIVCVVTDVASITLPSASEGSEVVVKKNDFVGSVTVLPASGTIDGASDLTISTAWDKARLFSDGLNWFII